MKKTVDLFTRVKSTEQAEMIATVLYSYDELKTHKGTISDKDVYDHIMTWKPHRKIEKEIMYCIADFKFLLYFPVRFPSHDVVVDIFVTNGSFMGF